MREHSLVTVHCPDLCSCYALSWTLMLRCTAMNTSDANYALPEFLMLLCTVLNSDASIHSFELKCAFNALNSEDANTALNCKSTMHGPGPLCPFLKSECTVSNSEAISYCLELWYYSLSCTLFMPLCTAFAIWIYWVRSYGVSILVCTTLNSEAIKIMAWTLMVLVYWNLIMLTAHCFELYSVAIWAQ